MNYIKNGVYGLVLMLLIGCTEPCEDCQTRLTGAEFFPLEVGRFIEYDVEEEEYALGRTPVMRKYQLKEVMAEKYTDVAGKITYRITRFRRNLDGQRWQPDSTLTIRVAIDHAIKNENGRDYIKMLFPPAEKSAWNANLYNNLGEDKYELKNVQQPFKVGTRTFQNTATVIQQSDSTLVDQDKRIEVYATDIGMVYREKINLQFCSSTPACVGKAQIDYGTRQYIRFKNTGKE